MDISIVIPALNEAGKIGRDVEAAARFPAAKTGSAAKSSSSMTEALTTTAEEARRAVVLPPIRKTVLRLERQSGKGAAVRRGVLESRGEVVLYADSGTCIPYANALTVDPKDRGRRAGHRPWPRAASKERSSGGTGLCAAGSSRGFSTGPPSSSPAFPAGSRIRSAVSRSTKAKAARELFAGLATPGFLFELEIILKALRRGYRLEEFPVEWTCDLDSRLRPAAQAKGVLKELLKVRSLTKK